jgi:tetratricopeptide (TPR) repeat protein
MKSLQSLVFIVSLTVFSTLPVCAQSKLTPRSFDVAFVQAYLNSNLEKMDEMVRENRSTVFPVFFYYLQMYLSDETKNKKKILVVSGALARAYDRVYHDNNLIKLLILYRSWGVEEKEKKQEAERKISEGAEKINKRDPQGVLLIYREALSLYQAIHDRIGEGTALGNLGYTYSILGENLRAISYYTQALNISRETGDKIGEVRHLGNLINIYKKMDDVRRAISYQTQSLKVSREMGDKNLEGLWLTQLGSSYLSLGDFSSSISYFEQAVKLGRELGDQHGEYEGLHNLGLVYSQFGYFRRSISYIDQSLAISRKLGDRQGEGTSLANLGRSYFEIGDAQKAISHLTPALKISREVKNRKLEGMILNSIGLTQASLGKFSNSISYYKQTLKIAREIGDQRDESLALNNLGLSHQELDNNSKATSYFSQALKIARKLKDRMVESTIIGNQGLFYDKPGKYPRAITHYTQALKISREIGDKNGEGRFLFNLGLSYRKLDDFPRAITYYSQALIISRLLKDRMKEVTILNSLGNLYDKSGKFSRAITYTTQALEIFREIGDRKKESFTLNKLGLRYDALGDARRGISFLNQALKIAREIGDKKLELNISNNLGLQYINLSDARSSISYSTQALKMAREFKDKEKESSALNILGLAHFLLGDARIALSYHTQALKIDREIGDRKSESKSLSNLGLTARNLGDAERALSYFTQAHEIVREIKDKTDEGLIIGNLGAAHLALGDILRAISLFSQALEIARETEDKKAEGRNLSNLGLAHTILGEIRKGIFVGKQGLKFSRETGEKRMEVLSLGILGNSYSYLGDSRLAIKYHTLSLEISREIGAKWSEGRNLYELGVDFRNFGDFRRAISYHTQSLKIAREIGNKTSEGANLSRLGMNHLLSGNFLEAERYLKNAGSVNFAYLKIAQRKFSDAVSLLKYDEDKEDEDDIGIPSGFAFGAFVTLARAHEGLDQKRKALRFYEKAVGIVESQRDELLHEQREYFFDAFPFSSNYPRFTPYEGSIRLSSPRKAFEFSEAIKARRMIELAAKREARLDVRVPIGLQSRERKLMLALSNLKNRKKTMRKRNDKKELDKIETALKVAREKRKALISRLYNEAPEYASIRYPRPLKIEEISLGPGEVLIEYALTESTLHAFFLRGKKIVKAIRKEVGRAEISKLIEIYRRQLSDPEKLTQPNFDHATGYRLYELLLKGILPLVQKDETVIIVPDGKLALLPFEAIPISSQNPVMKKNERGNYYPSGIKWLGDAYRLRYEQSASALTQRRVLAKKMAKDSIFTVADPVFGKDDIRSREHKKQKPSVFTKLSKDFSLMKAVREQGGLRLDRLPETGKLAKKLRRMFKKSDSLIGLRATKKNLKDLDLTGYRHLVFATHGLLSGKVSGLMEPALALAREPGTKEREAFLSLSEAMRLKLNADVVALTACVTGLGKEVAGEGVMGMGRAFQYAGAKSVLVSLWSVAESSTTKLVSRFFTHLKAGTDKVKSLRTARKEIRDAGYRHPFFWAPFILIGE